jgi:putative zinc finger protein
MSSDQSESGVHNANRAGSAAASSVKHTLGTTLFNWSVVGASQPVRAADRRLRLGHHFVPHRRRFVNAIELGQRRRRPWQSPQETARVNRADGEATVARASAALGLHGGDQPCANHSTVSRRCKRRLPHPQRNLALTVSDTDDLPCRELVELVTDYLENRLPDSTRRRFEAHLA